MFARYNCAYIPEICNQVTFVRDKYADDWYIELYIDNVGGLTVRIEDNYISIEEKEFDELINESIGCIRDIYIKKIKYKDKDIQFKTMEGSIIYIPKEDLIEIKNLFKQCKLNWILLGE